MSLSLNLLLEPPKMNIMAPEGAVAARFKRAFLVYLSCLLNAHGESMCVGSFRQFQHYLVNKTSYCFKMLLRNDLEQRKEIFGIFGQKILPEWPVKLAMPKLYFSSIRLITQCGKQHAVTVKERPTTTRTQSGSQNLQQALGIWWMTCSSSCCMQYWRLSSITQSVYESEQGFAGGNHQCVSLPYHM